MLSNTCHPFAITETGKLYMFTSNLWFIAKKFHSDKSKNQLKVTKSWVQ